MTRKFSRGYSLSVVVPFFAALIVLVGMAAMAQIPGAGQRSRQFPVLSGQQNAGAPAQASGRTPSPGASNAEDTAGVRSQNNKSGPNPMDGYALQFAPPVIYEPDGSEQFVVAADLNGDGHLDLVVAHNYDPGLVTVLLGNGDGTFQTPVGYPSGGSNALAAAVADMNGDGEPDLIVINGGCAECESGTVGVLLNKGDGTFQPAVAYDSGGFYPHSISVADLNGDGHPDAVVANLCPGKHNCFSGEVSVLLGNGDGTLQAAVPYDSGGYGGALWAVIGDVNGDGKPDVITANWYAGGSDLDHGGVGVLLGNGDGTFQTAVTYSSGGDCALFVAIGDVNGDEKPDIVVGNESYSDAYARVGVLLGNGDGTFQPALVYSSGGFYSGSIAIGDLNGDGKPDLAVANHYVTDGSTSGPVGVLLGNGDGTFQVPVTFSSGASYPFSVAIADLNGDGWPDLAVANVFFGLGVLLNESGKAPTTTTLASSLNPSVYGQVVTFTATVSSDGGTPTGTVEFFDGTTSLGSATLAQGMTSISVSSLVAGAHSIIAAYQGSPNFNPSTSAPLTQAVNTATTTTGLTSSLNPARPGRTTTYTATVTSQSGGVVTGTVGFQDGGTTVATVSVANNQAAYTTTYKKGGVHAMTALYSGDANNSGSTSATLMEYVEFYTSKTVLATSGSPSYVGQPVIFTATVTSQHGAIPDGELVTFYDGKTVLASVALAQQTAACTTSSLVPKTHYIKAAYPGDTIYEPSRGTVQQIVLKYPTATTLASTPNPSGYGQPVTFTAIVTPSGPYALTAKVRFFDGTTRIGSAALIGGVATLTKSTLAVGTHAITAQYVSDGYNDKSTSPVENQVVQ